MSESNKPFDLEAYMAKGVENMVKDLIKTSLFCPKETAFMAKYAIASKKASERRQKLAEEGSHIPPFLIASITSTCNLHCAGCYARSMGGCHDHAPVDQLSAEEWGKVFTEATELGVSFILLAGGEPLVRRDVILEAAKVPEILFPVFTNGTMLRGEYLQLFDDHRNLVPVISIEGGKEQTDNRRGAGVYQRLVEAMAAMKQKKIAFGASVTVTKDNMQEVLSDEFIGQLVKQGCKAVIYVEYVPVSEETEHLAPDNDDRDVFAQTLLAVRERYDSTLFISFPGDEKSSDGCLAAGRGFFHINSHGGAEPCPFSPFSDMNVKNTSLRDVVNSKLFTALRDGSMLIEDHKGGCVLYEKREQVEALLKDNQGGHRDVES